MRWETADGSKEHEIYHLFNGDNKLLTLSINSSSNSARVECNKEKRVFIIRKEGLMRNKTVLRNEYGVKIGEIGAGNKENFIEINDECFFYTTKDNPTAELVIYKEASEKPVLVCSLKTQNGSSGVHIEKEGDLKNATHPGLLMALCWYMFLPVANENAVA
jgi:hypothetical protein